jgi:hypothetical protein
MKSWESDIVKDNVLQFINTKLSGCIGPGLTSTEMATLSSESVLRFTRRTPPGFMDRLKIGDLIIWNEILNFSAAYQKNMILITRDLKIDWWCNLAIPYRKDRRDDKLNEDEKKLLTHARHELMSEFKTRSGKLFDVTTSTTLSEKWKMSPAVRNELQHLASSDVFADLANLATDGRRARLGEKFVKYTDIVAFAKNHCDNVIKGRVNFDRTVIESLINNGRLLLLDYSNILNQNMIYEIGYLLNVVVNQLNKAQTEPNYFVILTSMISHLMTLLDNTEKLLTQKHLNQPYFNLLDILKSNTNPT